MAKKKAVRGETDSGSISPPAAVDPTIAERVLDFLRQQKNEHVTLDTPLDQLKLNGDSLSEPVGVGRFMLIGMLETTFADLGLSFGSDITPVLESFATPRAIASAIPRQVEQNKKT